MKFVNITTPTWDQAQKYSWIEKIVHLTQTPTDFQVCDAMLKTYRPTALLIVGLSCMRRSYNQCVIIAGINIHDSSKKQAESKRRYSIVHNFAESWPIFITISLSIHTKTTTRAYM